MRLVDLALAVVGVAAIGAAPAQIRTPGSENVSLVQGASQSRGSVAPAPAAMPRSSDDVTESRVVMARYVRCLFRSQGYKMRRAALAPFESTMKEWRKLGSNGCLVDAAGRGVSDVAIKYAPNLIRGAAFEEMYRADFGDVETPIAGELAPISHAVQGDETGPSATIYRKSMALADCCVRRDPAGARALLLAEVGAAGERAAMKAFTPALSGCLDEGATFTLTLSTVRNITAEALYRLTITGRNGNA